MLGGGVGTGRRIIFGAKRPDITRAAVGVQAPAPGLGRGAGTDLPVGFGSLAFASFGSLARFFWEVVRRVMIPDRFVFRRVIMMGQGKGFGLAMSIFLLLVFIESIPAGNVVQTEDMFGTLGWEVLILDKNATGVWFSFVHSKIGYQFQVPSDGTPGLLLGNEVSTGFGFARV